MGMNFGVAGDAIYDFARAAQSALVEGAVAAKEAISPISRSVSNESEEGFFTMAGNAIQGFIRSESTYFVELAGEEAAIEEEAVVETSIEEAVADEVEESVLEVDESEVD